MSRRWESALAGVAAGAITLAVAEVGAAVLMRGGIGSGTASPLVAVAGAFVDRTPAWLKDFAIQTFGTNDKLALLVGMGIVLTALCALIGVLGAGRTKPLLKDGGGGRGKPLVFVGGGGVGGGRGRRCPGGHRPAELLLAGHAANDPRDAGRGVDA